MAVAILLVGGFGTRLMPLTKNTPKPMLTVAGLPVTEHQLAMAKSAGITNIILATSYLSEVFIPYFGDGSGWGMSIQYAVEQTPLGTGGAIRNAIQFLDSDESIVVLNGDVLSSHNLAKQIEQHEENNADVTLHLTQVQDARAFGCVPTDQTGRVTAFLEKMENPISNQINAGCYIFKSHILDSIALNTVVSIERETFPALVKSGASIFGYLENTFWVDIGTPRALLEASRQIVKRGGDYLVMPGSKIESTAQISEGSCVGSNTTVAAGVKISGSIIESNCLIDAGATIENSYIASGTHIAKDSKITASFATNSEIFPILG